MQNLYYLDHIKIVKKEDGSPLLRGAFHLFDHHDEIKRFLLLKRLVPSISHTDFKEIDFLRPVIYIDHPAESFTEAEIEKIKLELWQSFGRFFREKLSAVSKV
ncbi:hypothetical protein A2276_00830 [candidate division WOR-1 bacterium RIFOXYA12_FULL_43_27]|uniref:Uncharacterized protein n=1 Tax=candidate division WOR-1 bacterium RIFOXYC2_FULL_46_14 TaxID=1802587 RepID=A0A1F4U506_UNCSA|nr:MAG: hypothetical protein A2276_00830 [candidate division WOR-1 bacterium RIFOXYA12_FULL_43_27]OGC20770.1 MAG: hypothetical protein A2292_07045 [candidate division WOR-1 bacterium RIFOXYB2_FULL_46_45]OGC31493.1 MAG: hypothetical protein A2232_04405 [candidate division WOR-1 bacterium RIFOXYA2_FULL_46_56]OGC39900.1 MAG: hypothetical protein A2438_05245 [candidate division WOR-1 bacterium RIFOXYC2_FULL_46_14]